MHFGYSDGRTTIENLDESNEEKIEQSLHGAKHSNRSISLCEIQVAVIELIVSILFTQFPEL